MEESDKELVESLILLTDNRFEVWKYFEERADHLGEQLWTVGIWLMALLAARAIGADLPTLGPKLGYPRHGPAGNGTPGESCSSSVLPRWRHSYRPELTNGLFL